MQIVAPPKLEAMHHIHVVEFIDNALTMSDHHVDGASEERQVWDEPNAPHMAPDEIQKPFGCLTAAVSPVYLHQAWDEKPTPGRNIPNAAE